MSEQADIAINGAHLDDSESETIRMAIDVLTQVLAEGLEAEDEGIKAAVTERYIKALIRIRKLLDNPPERVQ